MQKESEALSRRSFLRGAALAGVTAASTMGMVACASPAQGDGAATTAGGSAVSWTKEADIVVVGGGASGCTASLAAGQKGASVVLLESSQALGGCGALCVGSVTTCCTKMQADAGITDTVADFVEDVRSIIGEESIKKAGDDWAISEKVFNEGGKTVDWLVENGVVFAGPFQYPKHKVPRIHALYPSSAAWPPVLMPKIEEAGVDIRLNTKGVELVLEGDTVVGVRATDQITNEEFYFKGNKGVVLACASIDSAYDQLIKVYSTDLASLDPCNRFNDASGMKMAAAIGAETSEYASAASISMRCQAPSPDVGSYSKQSWMPYGLRDAGAIMVNKEGKRYASEDLADREMIPNVLQQTDKVAYLVFDDAIARNFQQFPDMIVSSIPGAGWGTVDDFVAIGAILKADTIEEVARLAGIDGAGLAAEIATYNDYARAGSDPDFDRKKFGLAEAGTLNTGLVAPPFYIHGPQKGEIMIGGMDLRVTQDFAVINTLGTPIPGLYAVGILGHGLAPYGAPGHGGSMAYAFTTGRLIGEQLATA
ncbi:MAG: FAD-binding protein [Coriobacteriales bacterium]|jgi:fumarate reductase flavoprotein subunit|nr:FAD-binding protein [Coriobacteriales bacterium]